MSEAEENSNYSDIDYLLHQKQEELNELGAMRVRALERTNEELKEQVDKFSNLLRIKEEENDAIKQQLIQSSYNKEEYENKINQMSNTLQEKEVVFYNEIMNERKKTYEVKQELVNLLSKIKFIG